MISQIENKCSRLVARKTEPSEDIFSPEYSMFKSSSLYRHEFHYFVSQVYHGEKIGVIIGEKLLLAADNIQRKTAISKLLDDEYRHCDLFKGYITKNFGNVFSEAKGIRKAQQLISNTDDCCLLSVLMHGILEPCGMVTLKALRLFSKDEEFLNFTDQVMRDEAMHIQLSPSSLTMAQATSYSTPAKTAFRAMASIGRASELTQTINDNGGSLDGEAPKESSIYQKKQMMSLKIVKTKLNQLGIHVI